MKSFRTEITPEKSGLNLSHRDGIVAIGSCFAENISEKFSRYHFNCKTNSHGIIFNPFSVAESLLDLMELKKYQQHDLVQFNDHWLSLNHHGKFNHSEQDVVLDAINDAIGANHHALKKAKVLIVTFGSAWYYRYKETQRIVANCHKIPSNSYIKELAQHEDIVVIWNELVTKLFSFNPDLKIVLTVSPVRHWRDGVTQNQLSKSNLLIACHDLISKHKNISYFPSYELMMDDLRDYRFYAQDMIHPSQMAIDYIWQKFVEWCMDKETQEVIDKLEPLAAFLDHRPMRISEAQHQIVRDNKLKEMETILTNARLKL